MSLKAKIEKMPGYNSLVRPWHFMQALGAGVKNRWPAKKMRVIAVTGTNGKTTTSFFIWKMLNEAGHPCGILSTVAWGGVGSVRVASEGLASPEVALRGASPSLTTSGKATPQKTSSSDLALQATANEALELHKQVEHMTTERVSVLNERMRKIQEAGAEFLVLETTSHALMQSRLLGVPVEIGVFTNLTHEHLDYHKTFAKYRGAKGRLFKRAKYGVLNADDPSVGYFEKNYSSGEYITYGIKQGEMIATEVKLTDEGVNYSSGEYRIKTQIPGRFNVYNSLAAVCVGKKLGLKKKEIEQGIFALTEVEGRMNRIDEGQDFTVIVDYAHTPDAVEKVFASVKSGGRVIAVHGGAGRRDESTRQERGEILGKYSDIVIITEDDSRDEEPAKIAEQFVKGAEKAGKVRGKDLLVELDRQKAIEKAVGMAKKGDLVLILGKGHEKTILRADGAHPFEDIKVTKEALKGLGK